MKKINRPPGMGLFQILAGTILGTSQQVEWMKINLSRNIWPVGKVLVLSNPFFDYPGFANSQTGVKKGLILGRDQNPKSHDRIAVQAAIGARVGTVVILLENVSKSNQVNLTSDQQTLVSDPAAD